MLVSTKGRYALRVMLELAQSDSAVYMPLPLIAEKQGISEKYLESIIVVFSRAGYVQGQRGKGGGYRLVRDADSYTIGDVLRKIEGSLAPVGCLDSEVNTCPRAAGCKTLEMWQKYYEMTNEFFDGITVADLVRRGDAGDDYMI